MHCRHQCLRFILTAILPDLCRLTPSHWVVLFPFCKTPIWGGKPVLVLSLVIFKSRIVGWGGEGGPGNAHDTPSTGQTAQQPTTLLTQSPSCKEKEKSPLCGSMRKTFIQQVYSLGETVQARLCIKVLQRVCLIHGWMRYRYPKQHQIY